ncbi:MAG TPA: YiiD C-terminal domain-containing protein [Bacteroidales bacterium]|nr:MAG: hypothetical protein BWY22_00396 [Bacteroidetes bacterium ADurb.Bin217]HPH15832.1 YiiD C-terminal domain-containing protein [Bacteroidales bacterium]
MDNLSIPFHSFLNIQKSDNPDFILMIGVRPEYLNHVGTVHACVQITLAEATSGEFLDSQIPGLLSGAFMPVVRKSQHKYHKPANGALFAKARVIESNISQISQEIQEKGRSLFQIEIKVFDSHNQNTLTSVFDWFIGKI